VKVTGVALACLAAAACSAHPIDVANLPARSLDDNLVAHWSFDEGSGDAAHDDSGNLHDGTVAGATWVDGQFGKALHFVAGSSQVTVPSFPAGTPSYSVALWLRIASGDTNNYVTLVSTEIVEQGGWEMNTILDDATDTTPAGPPRYHFAYYEGPGQGAYAFVECDCIAFDRWVHLAAVVDGQAQKLRLYVDGALRHEVDTAMPIKAGTPMLYMGTWADPTMLRQLTGSLDDVAIWSRALVPEEIAALNAHALHGM
jgi:hypothetical protein